MVHCTIVGARGYLGRELVRILADHPEVETLNVTSTTAQGTPLGDAVPALAHTGLSFVPENDAKARDADVVFLATPGGKAAKLTRHFEQHGAKCVIDLSRDHRTQAIDGQAPWTYGLADIQPVAKGTARIANPGCYPTASLLALAPALEKNLIAHGPIVVDGKSGVSGAGVNPQAHLHYPEMNEAVTAYKVTGHDHSAEIQGAAGALARRPHRIRFTPHLIPQTRGLLATAYAPLKEPITQGEMDALYQNRYASAPFVSVTGEAHTGHVKGSNRAQVAVTVDEQNQLLVARGAIDNLCKGGSGTAVQNMNDALGLPSDTGLPKAGLLP